MGGRTSCRAVGKTIRPGRPAMHRCAATNGSGTFAKSLGSSVERAPTRLLSRSRTTSSARTSPAEHHAVRRISRPVSIRCCRTRRAGSLPRISTRSPGRRMWRRFVTRLGQKACLWRSSGHVPATALTHGFSSPSLFRRTRRGAWALCSLRQRWTVARISASSRSDRFFPSQDTMPAGGIRQPHRIAAAMPASRKRQQRVPG